MSPIRVLLIDHHKAFTTSTIAFLKLHPDLKVVATANDGDMGLLEAEMLRLDVILVGLDFDGSAGLQTIRRLRTIAPEAGIIALSLNDQNAYRQAALAAGANGFVPKVRVVEELVLTIQQVAQRPSQIENQPLST
jgi:DNA-binding NarL/FixJ family response regulator